MRENRFFKSLDRRLGIPLTFAAGMLLHASGRGRRKVPASPRRILTNKLSAVGDTVLLVPALRALRRRYPRARLTFLCSPVNRQVVECFPRVAGRPLVDEVVLFDLASLTRRPLEFLGFLRRLRQQRYDLHVDFDQWVRVTSLLSAAVAAPARLGYRTRNQHRHFVYTDTVSPPPDRHEVHNFLDLARVAGAASTNDALELRLPPAALTWAEKRLPCAPGNRFVAFHPGCGAIGAPRQWPGEYYSELGRRLLAERDVTLVLTGGPEERPLVERIAAGIGAADAVVVAAGRFTVARFAALLKRCRLLVCGNTGAMHVAAAVGTPVIALHGPTHPGRWGPLGGGHLVLQSPLPCSPCLDLGFEYGCSTYPCMAAIPVSQVWNAVAAALAKP